MVTRFTPKSAEDPKVPDLDVMFADKSVFISGTDPLTPSIRRSVAGVPGQGRSASGAMRLIANPPGR